MFQALFTRGKESITKAMLEDILKIKIRRLDLDRSKVLQWMMFLENPEDMEVTKIMSENDNIKKAKEELDKISRDDLLRRMALKAEIMRMDQHEFEEEAKARGWAEGLKEGKAKGYEEGLIEGEKSGKIAGEAAGKIAGEAAGKAEEKRNIAKRLINKGFSEKEVSEITELSIEEIKKIS